MKVEYDADGHYKIKMILVGESGVGKTNLLNIMRNVDFATEEEPTNHCNFFTTKVKIDNIEINLYLWDTIGQEKLRAQTKIFFKNSKIVVLVYDITNKVSFNKLEEWNQLVKENLGDEIVLGVLGNKNDLFLNEQVKEEEAEAYANSIGAKWSLGSAKTERDRFVNYICELVKIYIKKANIISDNNKSEILVQTSTIKIRKKKQIKTKHKCCK